MGEQLGTYPRTSHRTEPAGRCILAPLARPEGDALRLLQQRVLDGQASVGGFLDAIPEFELLWGDPRFEALFRPRT